MTILKATIKLGTSQRYCARIKNLRCIFPLILIEDAAIIILGVMNVKEQDCKKEQKQNKNVEFAKEIFSNENKKNEKQNKKN